MSVLADNIKFLRVQNNLSQSKLSGICGVDQALICQLETGVNTNPKLITLTSLAGGLHATVAQLIGEEEIVRNEDVSQDEE